MQNIIERGGLIQLLEHTPRNHLSRNETLHTRRSMSQKHVNT